MRVLTWLRHLADAWAWPGVAAKVAPGCHDCCADDLRDRLIALCRERQVEAADGGMTDADTIWPSELLNEMESRP